jgi:uncharacterized protein YcbX
MRLSEINVYPIKSLGGISLKNAVIENRGLQYDRRWMLINEKNKFLTQREFPKMATISVQISEKGLQVSSDGQTLLIPFGVDTNETASVKIWSSRCRANVYGNQTNEWFQDVLQTDCRLVRMHDESRRKVNYFYAVHKDDAVSFADAYPFLIIGENSLADLNSRLEKPVSMNRFRPNFVVSGAEPFAEDNWKKIKIGKCEFHVVKPCARCVITTIDQEKGIKQGVEPLKTLASFRIPTRSVKRKILFGQNLIAENTGETLNVGDKIEVLEVSGKKRSFINV